MVLEAAPHTVICDASDRIAWLTARRLGIGASESPAILGASPWSSGMAVYAEKVDPDPPVEFDNERLFWGRRLESVILERFGEITGREVLPAGQLLRSTRWPFMLTTLDGEQDFDGRWVPAEAKNTMDGEGWSDGVPRHVWIQLQHQMAVFGSPSASVAVLIFGCQFKHADVPRDDEFIEETLVPECEKFWQLVEAGGPPPQTDGSEATREALKRLYPQDYGETVALCGEFTDKAARRLKLKEFLKADTEELREIENAVKAAIGSATFGAVPDGGEYSWKANKNGVRTLRYKEPRGI